MKIAVLGAGAVGGFFGAKLATLGHNVTFIARGQHLAVIQQKGLLIKSSETEILVKAVATNNPETIGVVKLLMLAIKAHQVKAALGSIAPLVGPDTMILTLQNGIETEERVIEVFGIERVIAGVAYIASELMAPGVILLEGLGRIHLGELDGTMTDRVSSLANTLTEAGIPSKALPDMIDGKWRKLLWNAAFNPVTALTGKSVGDAIQNTETVLTLRAAMNEVRAVAAAEGHDIDPGLVDHAIDRTVNFSESRTSMLQDLSKGKTTEIDDLVGVIIKKAKKHNIPVPVCTTLYALVKAKEMGLP